MDLLSEAVTKIVEHSKLDLGSPDLKLVCLKGNHEDIMWQCCRQPIKAGWWMDNGGGATLISYGQNYGDIVNVKVVPEQHLRWTADARRQASGLRARRRRSRSAARRARSGPAVVEDLQGPRSARSWNATCRARASPTQGWSSHDRRSDKPRYTSLVYRPAGNRRLR